MTVLLLRELKRVVAEEAFGPLSLQRFLCPFYHSHAPQIIPPLLDAIVPCLALAMPVEARRAAASALGGLYAMPALGKKDKYVRACVCLCLCVCVSVYACVCVCE
jgi:hypothetical protein